MYIRIVSDVNINRLLYVYIFVLFLVAFASRVC